MSSRRHEQAEREMVAHEAGDAIKFFAGLFALFFVFPGPWILWNAHGHAWGLALLAVVANLLGALVVAAIVAVKVSEARKKSR
jgi:hypothetical protein